MPDFDSPLEPVGFEPLVAGEPWAVNEESMVKLKLLVDGVEIPVNESVKVVVELGDEHVIYLHSGEMRLEELHLNLTHEGLIKDAICDGEVAATECVEYDSLINEMEFGVEGEFGLPLKPPDQR